MRAVDENAFDSGYGINESQQLNNLQTEGGGGGGASNYVGLGGGGSSIENTIYTPYVDGNAGGVINVEGTSQILLTNQPNTSLSNEKYSFVLKSNEGAANVIVNGADTQNATPTRIEFNISDILLNGEKTITLQKSGYKTLDTYVVSLIKNPNHTDDYQKYYGDFNPASSIFGGMGGNVGFSGLGSFPTFNQNSPIYLDTPYYRVSVKHFLNGYEQTYENNFDDTTKILNFSLEKVAVDIKPTEDTSANLLINLNGSDNSVVLVSSKVGVDGSKTINLTKGNNQLALEAGSTISIRSANINKHRVTKINITAEGYQPKVLTSTNINESVSTELQLGTTPYSIEISSEVFITKDLNTPTISFTSNEKRIYNINSKADIPIGLTKSDNTTVVKLYIGNQTFTFDKLDTLGTSTIVTVIPARVFEKIGNYKAILVPSNTDGDGDSIEIPINVVDDVYVNVPDIRNIQYPALLRGPDFVGTNVDFTISYDSVNADYVKIYKLGSSQFIKGPKSGGVVLNFQKLLELDGATIAQTQDIFNLTLKLVPYNESGREVVVGEAELIDIKFDKGDLTIPRDVAISRIADGFISQFDTTIFEDETSKYLTHLLHLGDGDNKVITTWVGSEDSLILKLYEPLPTSVQPNQLVWISKLQSQPIIEKITINGIDTEYCHPLKGPNFTLEQSTGIGYQVFDELIASGSITSNDLVNRYLGSNGIDTTKLNINYVSGSDYLFQNFAHFSSAEERINNFFYKIQLIETYKAKYEALSATTFIPPYEGYSGGILTEDGYQAITEDGLFDIQWEIAQFSSVSQGNEAKKVLDTLNALIRGLDGYENFLYKSNNQLAYPKELYIHPTTFLGTYILKPTTSNDVIAWYESLVQLSSEYDKYNPNYLVNNVPEFIREDYNNNDFLLFLDMIGQHFDIVWAYIANLSKTKILEHKQVKGFSNNLVHTLLESFGWTAKRAFNSELLWEYAFGTNKDGFQKYGMPLADANDEVWRRILNNLPYLLKHKGTARAMKAIMACYGVPQSMLTIMEFGGPQDPTGNGSTKFTFDDRTASIFLTGSLNANGSSAIKIPWHVVGATGDYPNSIEFRILPSKLPTTQYTLISGSEWSLDLIQTTGSFGKLELNFGGDVANSTYFETSGSNVPYIDSSIIYAYGPDLKTGSLDFPISTEHYSNVVINRHNSPDSSSWFEVWLGTSDGQRIITSVSMSIATDDTQWSSGSYLQFGGNGYEGNMDEFRLWTVPLQRSKFENHTLFPDAINGNSHTASTSDLMFRLDFEYPKDRNIDPYIKNVAISDNYGEPYASASNFYSAPKYPYQYTPYDRTVTATVPSLGFNYSNKIRFEEQELISDLSYKQRATKKSFDRAPIDSNRLGLFFSPIKELNMDILKAFGDFNIDNYIGDPGDEYKDHYSELDTLRHYYFERLDNRDIYEYIRLIKYIDKSLFEVLSDLAPARTNISKGLLIEPHFLERSKTKWNKPESVRNDFETSINTVDNVILESESIPKDAHIDAQEIATLTSDISNEETTIDANEIYKLVGTNPNYDTSVDANENTKLEGDAPMYDLELDCYFPPEVVGEADAFTFEQIGMDRDSLANAGYGLYANHGNGIVRTIDPVFGNFYMTGSRKSIFLVKEKYTKKISTQIQGWPTNGALLGERVKYENVPVTMYKYKVSVLPFSGSISIGNNIVEVQSVNGYLPTHYKFVNNLAEGMTRSFWKGSVQTAATTPDGLDPVETFTTNPNILRVAKTGRGSGEPILEVD